MVHAGWFIDGAWWWLLLSLPSLAFVSPFGFAWPFRSVRKESHS